MYAIQNESSQFWLTEHTHKRYEINYVLLSIGGCFVNVWWVLENIRSKFACCKNRTYYETFKLKLCTCAQSHTLGTYTKFQLEILITNVISGIAYFREISSKIAEMVSRYSAIPSVFGHSSDSGSLLLTWVTSILACIIIHMYITHVK